MKKRIFVLLFFAVLMICMSAFADDLDDVKQTGELRFGVPSRYIPFVFEDEDGNMTGIDVALMEEIGKRMGVRVHVINLAYDGMIDALNLGQVDVIGGAFSITEEREDQIDFTTPYYNTNAKFVGQAGVSAPDQISPDDFRYLKIGVQKGTGFDQWVKSNLVSAGFVSPANVFTYDSVEDAMNALNNGDVELVLLDGGVYDLTYADSGNFDVFYEGFAVENYAFGLRKDSALTEVIDGHLRDMLQDKTAQAIADRFFGMSYDEALVTRDRSSLLLPPVNDQAGCVNGMVFVSDQTIKDGQALYAGESFTKVWRVKNTGSCTWTKDYSFGFVSGNRMGGRDARLAQSVAPGQTIDISVDMIAPGANGTYNGYWQMRSPQGRGFGQTVWVKVRVDGSAAAPSYVYQPVSIYAFYPDFYVGEAGECVSVNWYAEGADMMELSVDGVSVLSDDYYDGTYEICGPLLDPGDHIIDFHAYNAASGDYSSFIYTALDGDYWDGWLENDYWQDFIYWNYIYSIPEYMILYEEDPDWYSEIPEGPQDPGWVTTEFVEETEEPVWTPEIAEPTEEPFETAEPVEMEDPDATEEPEEIEDPDATEEPEEIEDPDATEEPEETEDPDATEEPDDPDAAEEPDDPWVTDEPDDTDYQEETEEPDEIPDEDDDDECDPDDPDYLECIKNKK